MKNIENNHIVVILAYNKHQMTNACINNLRKKGYHHKIYVFDNGSSPSQESVIKDKNCIFINSSDNVFVNPAWNIVIDTVNSKYITLLNNDCFILSKNYFDDIVTHMYKKNITISSCCTFNLKKLLPGTLMNFHWRFNNSLKYSYDHRRQGWIMTINLDILKSINGYRIPEEMKVWYGDDWIWAKILNSGNKAAIYKNRYAIHLSGSTSKQNKISDILSNDISYINSISNQNKDIFGDLHTKDYYTINPVRRIKRLFKKLIHWQ